MGALFQALYLAIEGGLMRMWAAMKAYAFSKTQSDARYWQKSEQVEATTLAAPARLAIVNEVEGYTDTQVDALGQTVAGQLSGKLGMSSTAVNSEQLGGMTLSALTLQLSGQITAATNQVLQTAKSAFAEGAKDFGLVKIAASNVVTAMTSGEFFSSAFGVITAGSWNDGAYHAQILFEAVDVDRKILMTMPDGSVVEMNNLDKLVFTIAGDAITGVTFVDDPIIELLSVNKSEINIERQRINIFATGLQEIIDQLNVLNFS